MHQRSISRCAERDKKIDEDLLTETLDVFVRVQENLKEIIDSKCYKLNKETQDKINFFSDEMIEVNQRMTALVCKDKTKAAEANLSLI